MSYPKLADVHRLPLYVALELIIKVPYTHTLRTLLVAKGCFRMSCLQIIFLMRYMFIDEVAVSLLFRKACF
jgi:hypothetical protein